MNSRQTGFTMIELIVVIVILGILAAVAIPRFVNMGADASQAAVAGVAGAAGSAMTLNYSGCALTGVPGVTPAASLPVGTKCVKVASCVTATVASLLQGGLPTGYATAASGADIGTTNGNTATCSVTVTSSGVTYTGSFTGIAAGN